MNEQRIAQELVRIAKELTANKWGQGKGLSRSEEKELVDLLDLIINDELNSTTKDMSRRMKLEEKANMDQLFDAYNEIGEDPEDFLHF